MSWRAAARQGLEPRPVRSSCSLIRTGSSETGARIRSLVAAFANLETWRAPGGRTCRERRFSTPSPVLGDPILLARRFGSEKRFPVPMWGLLETPHPFCYSRESL